jgi:hypothetical protein
VVADVVDIAVTGGGDVLLATSPLPHVGPQALHFEFVEGRIVIARKGQVRVAEKFIGLLAHRGRGIVPVRIEDVLHRRPGATRLPRSERRVAGQAEVGLDHRIAARA